MPRAGADKFGSARAAVKPRCFRGMRREHRKNRTRIGPHLAQPWAAERPVISVLEFGYVRRSEISFVIHSTTNHAKIAKTTLPTNTAGMKTPQLSVDQGVWPAASDVWNGDDSACCISISWSVGK